GALFVVSNADKTLPSARGRQPGNGSLSRVIATTTGQEPLVAGKPEPPLHAESVARTGARRPLVVGDRLDTDIEGAVRVGADSILVPPGVTPPTDAVLAPPHQRPPYRAPALPGLLPPHPPVTQDGAGFSCGGWHATWQPPRLVLGGDGGDPMDGLRA